jgi:two-component system, OmpR family, alkaline phosphatase synthesis response regulator PhoP
VRRAWILALAGGPSRSIGTLLAESGYEPVRAAVESVGAELEGGAPEVVVVTAGPESLADADAALAALRDQERLGSVPLLLVLRPEALPDAGPSHLADELLRTPVTEAELRLRIARAVRRLGGAGDGEQLLVGELALDFATHEARLGGRAVELTHVEYELLRFLATHPRRVFSRELLLDRVWGYDFAGTTRTVDVHVRRVRAKLGEGAAMIQTVRSVGYRFEP